jgi:ABC-type multidrug transport system ATPase subunit
MQTTTDSILRLESVTVRDGRRVICRDVRLSVPRRSVYVLLGRARSGKSSLLRCALGAAKPKEGAAFLFEQPARKASRETLAEIAVVPEEPAGRPSQTARELAEAQKKRATRWDSHGLEERWARLGVPLETPLRDLPPGQRRRLDLALALAQSPSLLVVDEPATGLDAVTRAAIGNEIVSERAGRELTVLAAAADASAWEALATHVGILKNGLLAVNESREALSARFRRLLYANEITPERTEYGNELDEFDAVRVRVRGWGTEAIVSNFTPEAFTRFTAIPGLADARAEELSLAEIFQAVDPAPSP